MRNLVDLLQAQRGDQQHGLRWAPTDDWVSYADLIEQAIRQAGSLVELGLSGKRILLVAENGPALVSALLACWWAGCLPACYAPPGRLAKGTLYVPELNRVAVSMRAEAGFADENLLEHCRGCLLAEGWHSLPMHSGPVVEAQPAQFLAYLQFSSGTTLAPRATSLSHANLLSNLEAIAAQLPGGRNGHSCVSWLPLYHDMGLVGCLLSSLYAPGDLTLMAPSQFVLRPGLWLDQISRQRATVSAAPNFALEQLLARDPGDDRDLSCLRMLLLGAETVRPSTLRQFAAAYAKQGLSASALTPVYGLAEATLAVTFSTGPKIEGFQLPADLGQAVTAGSRELVSLGRALPGVELTICDESGQAQPPAHLGMICIAGPSLAQGLPQPYSTGDVGFLWEDELYFVTRRKDVLVHNGRKHDPEMLEQLVSPLMSAAVTSPDDLLMCLVERPRRGTESDETMLAGLRERLSAAALPVKPLLVSAGWLPRTSSGKISRFQARQKLAAEDLA